MKKFAKFWKWIIRAEHKGEFKIFEKFRVSYVNLVFLGGGVEPAVFLSLNIFNREIV